MVGRLPVRPSVRPSVCRSLRMDENNPCSSFFLFTAAAATAATVGSPHRIPRSWKYSFYCSVHYSSSSSGYSSQVTFIRSYTLPPASKQPAEATRTAGRLCYANALGHNLSFNLVNVESFMSLIHSFGLLRVHFSLRFPVCFHIWLFSRNYPSGSRQVFVCSFEPILKLSLPESENKNFAYL